MKPYLTLMERDTRVKRAAKVALQPIFEAISILLPQWLRQKLSIRRNSAPKSYKATEYGSGGEQRDILHRPAGCSLVDDGERQRLPEDVLISHTPSTGCQKKVDAPEANQHLSEISHEGVGLTRPDEAQGTENGDDPWCEIRDINAALLNALHELDDRKNGDEESIIAEEEKALPESVSGHCLTPIRSSHGAIEEDEEKRRKVTTRNKFPDSLQIDLFEREDMLSPSRPPQGFKDDPTTPRSFDSTYVESNQSDAYEDLLACSCAQPLPTEFRFEILLPTPIEGVSPLNLPSRELPTLDPDEYLSTSLSIDFYPSDDHGIITSESWILPTSSPGPGLGAWIDDDNEIVGHNLLRSPLRLTPEPRSDWSLECAPSDLRASGDSSAPIECPQQMLYADPWSLEHNPNPVIFAHLWDLVDCATSDSHGVPLSSPVYSNPTVHYIKKRMQRETHLDLEPEKHTNLDTSKITSSPSREIIEFDGDMTTTPITDTSSYIPNQIQGKSLNMIAPEISTSTSTMKAPDIRTCSVACEDLVCEQCNITFQTIGLKNKHNNRKHIRRFACTESNCTARFNLKADLQRHKSTVHKSTIHKDTMAISKQATWSCTNAHCHTPGKAFRRKDNFQRHLIRCQNAQ
jgi:hypothetical protein